MFWPFLNSAYKCQGFLFPALHSPPSLPVNRLVVDTRLGGDTARKADAKGIFYTLLCQAQQQKLGVEEGKRWFWLPKCPLLGECLSIGLLVGGG